MEEREAPKVVSLVALGHSKTDFFNECAVTGNRRGVADEVWVINKAGVIFEHDMLFRMDDLATKYECNGKRYTGGSCPPEGKSVHETYDNFLKKHNKPIVTSKHYDEYPTSVEFPLEKVINAIGFPYFRTTPAYAAAFAFFLGVQQLRIYGCDYVYPSNIYSGEAGRANLEFILGVCMSKGMDVWVAPKSTLLDMNVNQEEKMYGYKIPMDIVEDPEDKEKWKVIERPDVYENKKKARENDEKAELQKLMTKYRDEVKHDLIKGKWITKEDIDSVEAK